ncbi:FAD-dependent monooxygenase [Nocardia bhagyanarayanae]|uniref:2-polyprenyl-6-methoxyphenol hydroxylase-like FAD-dependent oxidoreductase n=1 Tax=Nocardia bhagyanarayanae TaxID=1215925 RepID=A0A543FE32_9NOCA|nr:FAD-dependent monooxygenase [Nocardia bhagyanarayanae]TQM32097.1 2-polyprenyl-6-methoxyphenol hydroxylase-like FAD-dependent oxidoreductase [Nocardia bhagyanarayanae]
MTDTLHVLVVGAGPTGLALATELRRHGLTCRIIDRAVDRPANQARALTMWDGALDVLDRHGTGDAVRARGLPMTAARYFSGGRPVAQVRFGPETGNDAEPLIITQPSVESVLAQNLRTLGVPVEWRTELVELTDRGEHVEVLLRHDDADERLTAQWVVGCDGAHSAVRALSGITFEGSTYPQSYTLGDGVITAPVPPGEAHYHLHPDGVLVVVPLPDGQVRVFADASGIGGDPDAAPTVDDLQQLADKRAPYPIRIHELRWATRFLVHMRHSAAFRKGRCVLAGDAAHVHSPAGGQGLNTGIQDAANLGGKLAAIISGGADAEVLLAGYESERMPIAREVIQAADRQTKLWTVGSRPGRAVRDLVLGTLSRSGLLEKRLVPSLAQYELDYRHSPAVGKRGGRRALGRAIPEAAVVGPDGAATGLRQLLSGPGHVLLAVLDATPSADDAGRVSMLRAQITESGLPFRLHVIVPGDPSAETAPDLGEVFYAPPGFAPKHELAGCRLIVIRPDGYVADASPTLDLDELLGKLPGFRAPHGVAPTPLGRKVS